MEAYKTCGKYLMNMNDFKRSVKMEEQNDEYKFPVNNERTKDFIRALQSGDKKIIDLAYLALSPGEKIKYKMILTQARKKWAKKRAEEKTKVETTDVQQ